ncbi:unnamed protein product [Ambrosiozyma monospora]|uniref:Unnamed protein product n=1 Tax=Ambrosiozyma monospora TaxID=43982 RepID=A0ACB5TZ88_AMBMO|nr:unnamed protein product [Ambrosiozyma monospora]
MKTSLIENLIDRFLTGLQNNQLTDSEASLYLLNALMANFNETNVTQFLVSNVKKLLDTDFLSAILPNVDQPQFQYFIQTSIQFLSSIDWFYKSNTEYLPKILHFLFSCMFQSKYQLSSSKAIALICDDCRSDLDQFLPNFEEVINEMVNSVEVEPLIRERIINSYASIIQGVKDPFIQGENLIKILNLIDGKAYQVVAELNNANGNSGSDTNPDRITTLVNKSQ